MDIIRVEHLCKSYGQLKAVNDISFRVEEGEFFSFLGLNGAGKSTTISIICGCISKDSGTIRIDGLDAEKNSDAIKRKLGVVFQNSVLDRPLSVIENLRVKAAMYGITGKDFNDSYKRLSELLDFGDLSDRAVGKLSGGQRRRIDIARALIHGPRILILDEPTTGLDPQTRKMLWNTLGKLRKENKLTVFLTTHYMEEASDSDYVVIIDSGKIAASGTPLELKNKFTSDYVTLYGISENEVKKLSDKYSEISDGYRINVPDTEAVKAMILQNPGIFRDFEVVKGKMDDVFISVTGKKFSEE